MENILLHHCCFPCSPKAVESLCREFGIKSFWFNPNIHPGEEYELRKESLVRYVASAGIPLHFGPEYSQEWWSERQAAAGTDRCTFCYTLRLEETARVARREGLGGFSTTLLSSPYQKHELIKKIGEEAAQREGIRFVYRDFRPCFYEGKTTARNAGSYMQKYCGCHFSRDERIERDREKKKSRQ